MNVKKILIPLPSKDFDPSEAAIPWRFLRKNGFQIIFATPEGKASEADFRMVTGKDLGIFRNLMQADKNGKAAYSEMKNAPEFLNPIAWGSIHAEEFDGVILPGGHALGMREYLESKTLHKVVADFFGRNKPVGAICHGVVLAARSKTESGKSVLFGRKTTALLKSQELTAWALTALWLGSYYRTYSTPVEAEVKSVLQSESDFIKGPVPFKRDSFADLTVGFVVIDKNYVSARWPGDAHLFAQEFKKLFL